MTIYNTYQEAKVANPEDEIYCYLDGSLEEVFTTLEYRAGVTKNDLCNPADYCMTYNQCSEFKAGMVVMDLSGVGELSDDLAIFMNGIKGDNPVNWDKCFILHAAALEEKPKRVKVEYVKVDRSTSIFTLADDYHNGILVDSDKNQIKDEVYLSEILTSNLLYRKVETEISERDEFISVMNKLQEEYILDDNYDTEQFGEFLFDSGCRFPDNIVVCI